MFLTFLKNAIRFSTIFLFGSTGACSVRRAKRSPKSRVTLTSVPRE